MFGVSEFPRQSVLAIFAQIFVRTGKSPENDFAVVQGASREILASVKRRFDGTVVSLESLDFWFLDWRSVLVE